MHGAGGNTGRGSGPTEGSGPEMDERAYGAAGEGVDERPGDCCRACDLGAELAVEPELEEAGGFAAQDALRREHTGVERNGHTVAGKRGDDGGLIADGPEVIVKGVFPHETVRDRRNGERLVIQSFGCCKPGIGMARALTEGIK